MPNEIKFSDFTYKDGTNANPIMKIGKDTPLNIYATDLSSYKINKPALDSKETSRNASGELFRNGYKGRFLTVEFTLKSGITFTNNSEFSRILEILQLKEFPVMYVDITKYQATGDSKPTLLSGPIDMYGSIEYIELDKVHGYKFPRNWAWVNHYTNGRNDMYDLSNKKPSYPVKTYMLCKPVKVNLISYRGVYY